MKAFTVRANWLTSFKCNIYVSVESVNSRKIDNLLTITIIPGGCWWSNLFRQVEEEKKKKREIITISHAIFEWNVPLLGRIENQKAMKAEISVIFMALSNALFCSSAHRRRRWPTIDNTQQQRNRNILLVFGRKEIDEKFIDSSIIFFSWPFLLFLNTIPIPAWNLIVVL